MPSRDRTQTLILDTAPLLASSLTDLLKFSNRFVTTRGVIEEVRDKGQRERLEQEWKTLDATRLSGLSDSQSSASQWLGLNIREPSAAAIVKIKDFARKTGDIAVLSSIDIGVLALAYDVEVEENGTWRLRDDVGGRRNGKDPEKKKERLRRKQLVASDSTTNSCEGDTSKENSAYLSSTFKSGPVPDSGTTEYEKLVSKVEATTLENNLDLSGSGDGDEARVTITEESVDENPPITGTTSDSGWTKVPVKKLPSGDDSSDNCSETSSVVSESDPSWITPQNLHVHQAKDLGLFPTLSDEKASTKLLLGTGDSLERSDSSFDTEISKIPTMKAALLTGDFAMQNVALQIGLNVLGVGGKRVRDVKTWILRCYGCFKLCKDPTKKFCPKCGGTTLTRVSITYTPSSPTGYVLHLKSNFQYRNRGTVYSIPSPKPGSASFEKGTSNRKAINGASLILREDQKEFQQGLKNVQVQKFKEERNLAKANREKLSRGQEISSFGGCGWNDPDWEAPMLLGERGRKGGSGRNQSSRGVRYGKDGLPVIGFGKNPNEARRRV
ncbi:Nin one binding Zn-ribbon like-domain-containing protein [Phakopsora pachyrhizi]|uniref:20S-pre-rRNA D-site endonuclease NOB1 n=1 Tax=Phakopsora pachyrhizi TaxID=170000 RepID=A0AAV0BKD8_PHAPC|nr:Nin one binding Zn-ribbon like-domain-containing protein [Phakopsora pachyrhizi]CAH7686612.1 Nin one binding Zn-ribbon like-domain-containing protein [Phakopsora pachyrhizi]